MLRILSWNVDGLAARTALTQVITSCGGADVVCLQEVRIRASDEPAIERMSAAMGDGYQAHASLNRDPYNGRFRGGRTYGVVTYVRRELGAIAEPALPWDREGRVVRVRMPDGLSIANVYAVNGTWRPHHDSDGAPIGTRHEWKREMIRLLADVLAPDAAKLVAIGDWNVSQSKLDTFPRLRTEEPHATARRELAEGLVARLDLVDAFRALHPDERRYTWFDRRAEHRGQLDAARVDFRARVSRAASTCRVGRHLRRPRAPGRQRPCSVDTDPLDLSELRRVSSCDSRWCG